jgi:DNA-binding transcriptional LysR family regulator
LGGALQDSWQENIAFGNDFCDQVLSEDIYDGTMTCVIHESLTNRFRELCGEFYMRRPKVKLDNLVAVITVAEKRYFDLAASEIGLTASAVRKQIDAVEAILGVRLFEGKKGHVALTEEGESFLPEARMAVERAILAEEKTLTLQTLKRHHLLIGHSTYLPPRLISLIRQVKIEAIPLVRIKHVSALTRDVVKRVFEGSLHAGFGFLPIEQPELLCPPIYEEPLQACIPSSHRLAARAIIHPQDLDGEPMIAVAREPLPQLHREIEEHFSGFGISLNIVADAFAPPEALNYVGQKIGICLLASSSIFARQGIVVRPLSTRILVQRSGLFFREDNQSPILQRFIQSVLQQSHARLKP